MTGTSGLGRTAVWQEMRMSQLRWQIPQLMLTAREHWDVSWSMSNNSGLVVHHQVQAAEHYRAARGCLLELLYLKTAEQPDLHVARAVSMFVCEPESVTYTMRGTAKVLNHRRMYEAS